MQHLKEALEKTQARDELFRIIKSELLENSGEEVPHLLNAVDDLLENHLDSEQTPIFLSGILDSLAMKDLHSAFTAAELFTPKGELKPEQITVVQPLIGAILDIMQLMNEHNPRFMVHVAQSCSYLAYIVQADSKLEARLVKQWSDALDTLKKQPGAEEHIPVLICAVTVDAASKKLADAAIYKWADILDGVAAGNPKKAAALAAEYAEACHESGASLAVMQDATALQVNLAPGGSVSGRQAIQSVRAKNAAQNVQKKP